MPQTNYIMITKEILAKSIITPLEYEYLKEQSPVLIEDIRPNASKYVSYINEHGMTCQRLETTEYINENPKPNDY